MGIRSYSYFTRWASYGEAYCWCDIEGVMSFHSSAVAMAMPRDFALGNGPGRRAALERPKRGKIGMFDVDIGGMGRQNASLSTVLASGLAAVQYGMIGIDIVVWW